MKYTRRDIIRGIVSTAAGAVAGDWIGPRARQADSADSPGSSGVVLPEIPLPRSDVLHGIRWLGNEFRDRNGGDVWSTTWATDDNLYSVADDTQGWNLSVFKIEGMPPGHKVTRVNAMQEYFPAGDGPWWKGAGLACIGGVLYLGIYSQSNPSRLSSSKVSFNADHSSIIKSADYGKTWSGSAKDHLARPMFPKKEFPTPFFVQYGKDYAGAMDEYVYLCSNDGGWNNWNRMMLARVLRKKLGELDRRDWEFFVAADGQNHPKWTADVSKTGSIFEHNPCFPAKWFEDGGKRLWAVQGGNYRGGGGYQFITRKMEWN
ncbi:MAG: hypothetical protein ABSF26_09655 [Thermoguttaceae bacterium]|jgi:hypothetical protein